MYTRKHRRKKRKTKRGGLGSEVYMMTGLFSVLNGLMMSFGTKFQSYDTCGKEAPFAEANHSDPVATYKDHDDYLHVANPVQV